MWRNPDSNVISSVQHRCQIGKGGCVKLKVSFRSSERNLPFPTCLACQSANSARPRRPRSEFGLANFSSFYFTACGSCRHFVKFDNSYIFLRFLRTSKNHDGSIQPARHSGQPQRLGPQLHSAPVQGHALPALLQVRPSGQDL